jgi:hypothetical protein
MPNVAVFEEAGRLMLSKYMLTQNVMFNMWQEQGVMTAPDVTRTTSQPSGSMLPCSQPATL